MMDQYRELQKVQVSNKVQVAASPKMFTLADGVQVAVVDLNGFKGNKAVVKATINVHAAAHTAQGHVGVFIDDNIHPLTARDFTLDNGTMHTYELACEHIMEKDKTHIQVRVAAMGSVNVIATIDAAEMTLTPGETKQIVGALHPSLVVEPPSVAPESFLTSAPPGEAT